MVIYNPYDNFFNTNIPINTTNVFNKGFVENILFDYTPIIPDTTTYTTNNIPKYMYAATNSGYIQRSSDSGSTWTECTTPGSRDWRKIRCSDNGRIVFAIVRNANYWWSDDFGVTWNEEPTNRDWRGCDVSGDGQYLALGSFDGNVPHISQNYGQSFASNTNFGGNTVDMSLDDSGKVILRATYGNSMELSTDYGVTVVNTGSSRNWRQCAVSNDGQNIIACYDGGGADYTTNGGTSWTSSGISITWSGKSDISADGTTMIAVADGKSHISTNSGTSWTSDASSENWNDIVASETGKWLLGARSKTGANYPHISDDSGATWTALTAAGSGTWVTVAIAGTEPDEISGGTPVATISPFPSFFRP